MKRFVFFLVTVAIVGSIGWFLSVNAPKGRDLLPDPTPTVRIESLTPSLGSIGTEVTITGTGFSTDQNDIGFSFSKPQSLNFTTGYMNLVKSPDGRTIQFTLPSAVGVCAASTAPPETACIELALIIPKEKIEIFIVNSNGQSNRVSFIVN